MIRRLWRRLRRRCLRCGGPLVRRVRVLAYGPNWMITIDDGRGCAWECDR